MPQVFTVAYPLQVEHSAVNRVVVGSSPTRGVSRKKLQTQRFSSEVKGLRLLAYLIYKNNSQRFSLASCSRR